MDTISLNIGIIGNNSFNLEDLAKGVNNIHSPYGYTYCDFIKLNSNYEFNIKVSYPRFFKGINAFLLENPLLCKEVNQHLVDSLKEILSFFRLEFFIFINLIDKGRYSIYILYGRSLEL